ncbi:hypothetical protein DOJK_02088 [Patescibacteria group bacterium]|nr:hypothetical protein DOJK_02088 [Patescibacteria group bacterium]
MKITGHKPLIEYPWSTEIDRLLNSLNNHEPSFKAFLFDIVMSMAYMDATAGLEKSIEYCENISDNYNAHIGFINLCAPCYENNIWQYQKAAKPESGALGKLSSEIILKFIEHYSGCFESVTAIGGSDYADAMILHKNGTKIFAEVKSAPLITYPLLININQSNTLNKHQKINLTSSQLKVCDSALYLHNQHIIPLGKIGSENWPFKAFVDFATNKDNQSLINTGYQTWLNAKLAYINKDRNNPLYYLTNACGNPPIEAKKFHDWPHKQVISDSKTSAGMDRTDDIKKGIYQTLKIGITHQKEPNCKTALISNLPAYRHNEDYIQPFVNMFWGVEQDLIQIGNQQGILKNNLHYVFDYIITLENPLLRDLEL